jgi:hypothetical protein
MVIDVKGEIFITGAVLIIVLLALMASSIASAPALPLTIAASAQLDNLEQEYRYTAGLSAADGLDRMDELSGYLHQSVRGFDSIYALITVSGAGYELIIGNFMRNDVDIRITAAGSSPSAASANVEDGKTESWSFSSSGDVQLTIRYTIQNMDYTQSLEFATEEQTVSWFDIGIRSDEGNVRRSGIWNLERGGVI